MVAKNTSFFLRIHQQRKERGMKEAKDEKWEEGGKKRIPLRERAGTTALNALLGAAQRDESDIVVTHIGAFVEWFECEDSAT